MKVRNEEGFNPRSMTPQGAGDAARNKCSNGLSKVFAGEILMNEMDEMNTGE